MSPDPLQVIFGIGNPGRAYRDTRHNVGWMVLDCIAEGCGVRLSRRAFHARVADARLDGRRTLLVQPRTYVNRVGSAARDLMEHFALEASDLLAVVDDVHLPVGRIRLRRAGSAGGHGGLASLIETLGEAFPRLRVGVGAPDPDADLVEHVLGPFEEGERPALGGALARAVDGARMWRAEGVEAAMNAVNPAPLDPARDLRPPDPDAAGPEPGRGAAPE